MNEKHIYEGKIAGVNFKKDAWRMWLAHKPKVGDAIFFYHETKNKYDPKAIAIKYAQRQHAPKLGYIPREFTVGFHAAHELGMRIRGEVILLDGPDTIIRAYPVRPVPILAAGEEI